MPRGLVVTASVLGVIPYVNIGLGFLFAWPIALVFFQRAANRLAALPQLGEGAAATETAATDAAPQLRVPVVGEAAGQDEVLEYPPDDEADDEARKSRSAAR